MLKDYCSWRLDMDGLAGKQSFTDRDAFINLVSLHSGLLTIIPMADQLREGLKEYNVSCNFSHLIKSSIIIPPFSVSKVVFPPFSKYCTPGCSELAKSWSPIWESDRQNLLAQSLKLLFQIKQKCWLTVDIIISNPLNYWINLHRCNPIFKWSFLKLYNAYLCYLIEMISSSPEIMVASLEEWLVKAGRPA